MELQWSDYFFLALALVALARILFSTVEAARGSSRANTETDTSATSATSAEAQFQPPQFRRLDSDDRGVRYTVKFDSAPGAPEYVWFEPVWQDDPAEL